MVTVLYHCPNTGFRVQGYTAEENPADREGSIPVTCLALVAAFNATLLNMLN
jgi:hypothetical protein